MPNRQTDGNNDYSSSVNEVVEMRNEGGFHPGP